MTDDTKKLSDKLLGDVLPGASKPKQPDYSQYGGGRSYNYGGGYGGNYGYGQNWGRGRSHYGYDEDDFDDDIPDFMDKRGANKPSKTTTPGQENIFGKSRVSQRQALGSTVDIVAHKEKGEEYATIANEEVEKLANLLLKGIADVLDGADIVMRTKALETVKATALIMAHDITETGSSFYRVSQSTFIPLEKI